MIYELQELGIDLKGRKKGNVKVKCPQCSHTRKKKNDPCLSVNVEEGTYYCHNCNWKGGVSKPIAYIPMKKTYKPIQLKTPLISSETAKALAEKRGIGLKTLEAYQIREGIAWMPSGEKKVIQFPFYEGETVVNIKYRGANKEFRQEKDAKKVFFGMQNVNKNAKTLTIVEGEFDCLAAYEAGYDAVVSVPDGAINPDAEATEKKMEYLLNCEDFLKRFDNFILACDNDAPGKRLTQELARRLGKHKCGYLVFPEDCKDLNEVLIKHGKEKIISLEAEYFPLEGVVSPAELSPQLLSYFKDGEKSGDKLNLGLDDIFTWAPCQLTVITGVPGSGKSRFVEFVSQILAKRYGWNWAFYTPEHFPLHRHMATMSNIYQGKPFKEHTEAEVMDSIEFLNNHYNYLSISDKDVLSIEDICTAARQLVLRHGIKGLVIDTYTNIDSEDDGNLAGTRIIQNHLNALNALKRETDLHIIILAHPKKLDGKDPCPTPYDISGSAHWANMCDNTMTVYHTINAMNEREWTIYTWKVKRNDIGKRGEWHCYMDLNTARFWSTNEEIIYGKIE